MVRTRSRAPRLRGPGPAKTVWRIFCEMKIPQVVVISRTRAADEMNVRTYYDAVVSPSVAKLWWKIRPARPKNVVPMKAAA